jgi:hypothetical protein
VGPVGAIHARPSQNTAVEASKRVRQPFIIASEQRLQ